MTTGLFDSFVKISAVFPPVSLKGKMLETLWNPDYDSGRYASFSITAALFLSAVFSLFMLFSNPQIFIPGFFASFAVLLSFLFFLPFLEKRKKESEIEMQLPLFLSGAGMLMEAGVGFERAVRESAKGRGILEKEINRILFEKKEGADFGKLVSDFAGSMDSIPAKRALTRLVSTYRVGGGGREMRVLGEELMDVIRHKEKQYSSKSTIFGLLFIISSAVLPTFFIIYTIVSGMGTDAEVNRLSFSLAMLVLFPLVSILILEFSKMLAPQSPFDSVKGTAPEKTIPFIVFIGVILAVPEQLRFPAVVVGGAVLFAFSYKTLTKEKRIEGLESGLPDALLSISTLPKSEGAEGIFRLIESGEYGPLSDEAAVSRVQIEDGMDFRKVLRDFRQRNHSEMIEKTFSIIEHLFDTDSLNMLGAVAEDVLKHFEIRREREGMMSMQKYTLFFGGILVPLIIGISLSMLSDMGAFFESGDIAGFVLFSKSLVSPYLLIYSAICAYRISGIEGKRSSAAVYFSLIAVVSMAVFHLLPLLWDMGF